MDNKKLTEFNLIDVIDRKIHFIKTNTLFDKKEFEDYDKGQLLALNEILADVKEMNEDEFVNKYLDIARKLSDQFKAEEMNDDREIERLSGYNNAIISFMMYINPKHQYDLED